MIQIKRQSLIQALKGFGNENIFHQDRRFRKEGTRIPRAFRSWCFFVMNHPANFYDRIGFRYSRLVVIGYAGQTVGKKSRWLCRCDCGSEKIVSGANLQRGSVLSCGCFGREAARLRLFTHGQTNSLEYKSWCGMKDRCTNSNSKDYPRYGGRGIKVCKRWLKFENFLADMGRKPTPKHSIEMVGNFGNYEPGNCKWATAAEQSNNRRSSRFLTYMDSTLTITQWASRVGIRKSTIRERLERGWGVAEALTTLVHGSK